MYFKFKVEYIFVSKILFFRSLLAERKAMKENAPMTDRLMAKALALHVE